jgi:hypothetical protein
MVTLARYARRTAMYTACDETSHRDLADSRRRSGAAGDGPGGWSPTLAVPWAPRLQLVSAGLELLVVCRPPQVKVTATVADAFPKCSICGLPYYYLSGDAADWRSLAHRITADLEAVGAAAAGPHRPG